MFINVLEEVVDLFPLTLVILKIFEKVSNLFWVSVCPKPQVSNQLICKHRFEVILGWIYCQALVDGINFICNVFIGNSRAFFVHFLPVNKKFCNGLISFVYVERNLWTLKTFCHKVLKIFVFRFLGEVVTSFFTSEIVFLFVYNPVHIPSLSKIAGGPLCDSFYLIFNFETRNWFRSLSFGWFKDKHLWAIIFDFSWFWFWWPYLEEIVNCLTVRIKCD